VDEYVLCSQSGEQLLFACGDDPRDPRFAPDRDRARRFPTPEAAVSYRDRIVGGGAARSCAVRRLLAGGRLLAAEPQAGGCVSNPDF